MSSSIDKQWMKESARRTRRYVEGVQKFIEFVVENGGNKEIYSCPCTKCNNMKMKIKLDDIHYHLLRWGIVQSYTVWHFHGEESTKKQKQYASPAASEDPTKEIARRQVWEKTHTKKDDGSISDATSAYFGKSAKAKESIIDSDEEDLPLDEDILSQAFDKDKGGRTRSIETKLSRTQVKVSNIARKQLKKAQGDSEDLKTRMDNIEGTLKTLVGLFKGYMGQENRMPDIASNEGGSGAPQGSVGRTPNNDVANPLNSSGSANQKCEILNIDLEVIAVASVCRDSTSSIIHGKPVPPTHEKLVVDNILLPEEKTTKQNHPLAMTFGEVGIGGYVCHPKNTIRYL